MRRQTTVPKPISIITAVHNALPMNQLYWKALSENTTCPFQLVLVDNHSTDGSETFFSELPQKTPWYEITYLRNDTNQSYPASQNQGMKAAKYDVLCFLNNDIWMPVGWNEAFQRELEKSPYQVLSPCGQEAQPTQRASDQLKRKWKRALFLSRVWKTFFQKTEVDRLWWALRWMYGDLKQFKMPFPVGKDFVGIKGDSVIFHKRLLEVLPMPWDERVQAADWHLFLTVAKLHETSPAIPLPKILKDVYVHHFGRYSAKLAFEPLAIDFLKIEDLWTSSDLKRLWWGNHLPA